MRVEIRLKRICERHGLDAFGKISRIAREAGLSRRLVEALYENKRRIISIDHIERVCDWLRRHHVDEDLPGALFGYRPSHLLSALAEPRLVRFYLGEYRQRDTPTRWVSRADAEVAAVFTELLSGSASRAAAAGDARPDPGDIPFPTNVEFRNSYVPSHFAAFGATDVEACDDTTVAEHRFAEMRDVRHPRTNILIGSQRANHLVELFVADFFDCTPFEAGLEAPLYLYRPSDDGIASCFGGAAPPAGAGSPEPGIHYRVTKDRWACSPVRPTGEDAGIVMVRRDPGTGQTEIAVFGYSGRATRALGDIIRSDPDAFWKDHEPLPGGLEGRVYVCELALREDVAPDGTTRLAPVRDVRIVPLPVNGRARPKSRSRRSR